MGNSDTSDALAARTSSNLETSDTSPRITSSGRAATMLIAPSDPSGKFPELSKNTTPPKCSKPPATSSGNKFSSTAFKGTFIILSSGSAIRYLRDSSSL
ncbi:hypothetical protein [Rubritalea tangerina]|uniref:hypothetical protein n=1 Tax=Rubritalea tangerina TaxID=430798 RepID=UPI003617B8FB